MNKKTEQRLNKHYPAGYTLIEILMVLALSGFVSFMVLNSLLSSKNLFKETADKTQAIQQIRRSMSMICKDIQNVVRSSDTFFVGLDKQINVGNDSYPVDSLTLKLLSKKSTRDISGDNSFVIIKYYIDYDEEGSIVSLKKTIESYDNTDVKKTIIVCKSLNGINFRYRKGKIWYKKWDSRLLPDAVEITFLVDTEIVKTLPQKLQTIVSIIS